MNKLFYYNQSRSGNTRIGGFTLIEIMVTVVIIGILIAVALPSYSQHVRKGRRTDAKNAVLELAAREEKFFATNNTYSISGVALNYSGAFPLDVGTTGATYYSISVAQTTTSDFTVTATPVVGSAQANDECKSYILNNLGVQSNGPGAITTCW